MNLLLTANWDFGMNELINCIAAFLTLLAICVSLYLSQKSKTLKFKVLGRKINKTALQKHQYQQIDILNNGHTKFTCTAVGYYFKKQYFFVKYVQGIKKLDVTIIEQHTHSKNHISTENVLLPTYIQEGDMLQLGLWPADYDFSNTNKKGKLYIFLIINGKVYKFYTGYKLDEFLKETKDFDKKSLHNQSNIKGSNITEDYFR